MMAPALQYASAQIAQAMYEQLCENGGEVEVDVSGNHVEIIRLIAGVEGQGDGTRAMIAACNLADKFNITLVLTPDGSYYEDSINAQKRLYLFYSRFGFVSDKNNKMIRVSQQ